MIVIHASMDRVVEKETKVHVPQPLQLQVSRDESFIYYTPYKGEHMTPNKTYTNIEYWSNRQLKRKAFFNNRQTKTIMVKINCSKSLTMEMMLFVRYTDKGYFSR